VSEAVTLSLRSPLDRPLEVDGVSADRFLVLTEREIASLPVWRGREKARLGDFFDVRGERASHVRLEGDLARVSGIATRMASGNLLVDGDVGHRVAAGMTGGSVEVRGRAGDDAGVAMGGGTLRVKGSVGDRLGANEGGASVGMTGGEIVVDGSAGTEAGARCRRGLIVVVGDMGDHAARATIAGTLVALGRTGLHPGRGSKRGSIVAARVTDVPATYQYACTYEPPFVRLLMTYLQRRYGIPVDERFRDGRFHRYCGDGRMPGKGEILAWAAQSPD
jgi:formylmethanofuran dehydrogenase subunit C